MERYGREGEFESGEESTRGAGASEYGPERGESSERIREESPLGGADAPLHRESVYGEERRSSDETFGGADERSGGETLGGADRREEPGYGYEERSASPGYGERAGRGLGPEETGHRETGTAGHGESSGAGYGGQETGYREGTTRVDDDTLGERRGRRDDEGVDVNETFGGGDQRAGDQTLGGEDPRRGTETMGGPDPGRGGADRERGGWDR